MDDKKQYYIADVRQWIRDYQQVMRRAWELQNNWGLYQSLLTEEDMPDDILPVGDPGSRLAALTDAFANLQSIFASFDAGIDTNFERVA